MAKILAIAIVLSLIILSGCFGIFGQQNCQGIYDFSYWLSDNDNGYLTYEKVCERMGSPSHENFTGQRIIASWTRKWLLDRGDKAYWSECGCNLEFDQHSRILKNWRCY